MPLLTGQVVKNEGIIAKNICGTRSCIKNIAPTKILKKNKEEQVSRNNNEYPTSNSARCFVNRSKLGRKMIYNSFSRRMLRNNPHHKRNPV